MVAARRLAELLAEAGQRVRPFYDALREDRFFLACSLVGSYLTIQITVNALTGRYVSVPVFFLGVVTLLSGTLKRLTDLDVARIQREATGP